MRSEAETNKMRSTEEYRSDITLHLVRISSDVEHIKEDVGSVINHLEKINGRLRTAENSITALKTVGSTLTLLITIALTALGGLKW